MTAKNILGNYSDPTGTYTFDGLGLVPIGGIIAIGDAGAWTLPANGQIKDGWALCNGQAKPVGSAAGLGANLPDLTDDRFLNGSTVAGGIGGTASKTTTGIAASFYKNEMNSGQNNHSHGMNHTHGMDHRHAWAGSGTNTKFCSWRNLDTGDNAPDQNVVSLTGLNGNPGYSGDISTSFLRISGTLAGGSHMFTGKPVVRNSSSDQTNGKTSTDDASLTSTGDSTVSWTVGATVNTTVTQGTIADIRPKYLNVVYVMRVR